MISPREIIQKLAVHLQRLLTRPTEELSRAQRSIRYMYEMATHCISELGHDQALQMAAALTYRTLFSLIPIFVLALVVFRLTGGLEDMRQQIQGELYNYLGLNFTTQAIVEPEESPVEDQPSSQNAWELITPTPLSQAVSEAAVGATSDAHISRPGRDRPGRRGTSMRPPRTESERQETRASLDKIIQDLTDKVSSTSASGVTVVGLLVLIWAAVSLVVTVEQCLNQVYGTPTGRPWHMKILIYWGVITLGPVLLAVSLYVAGQIMGWANTLGPVGWLAQQLSRFTALAASWLLLFLLYVLMPNTRVHLKPAAIGAFVAACLWELGKWGFKLYAANAGFTTLYGSLAMIPLFFYWVYITWAIVLFGAELSYTLQAMQGREFKHESRRVDRQIVIDPRWILPLLTAMGRDFDQGRPSIPSELTQRLSLPHRAVTILMRKLAEQGLLHRVDEQEGENQGSYMLARTPDRLRVADLLEVGSRMAQETQTQRSKIGEWRYLQQLDDADHQVAGDTTLMDLIQQQRASA